MMFLLAITLLVPRVDERPDRLPGSHMSAAEAHRRAMFVIEAKLLHLGEPRESFAGEMAYPQTFIEPLRMIRGEGQLPEAAAGGDSPSGTARRPRRRARCTYSISKPRIEGRRPSRSSGWTRCRDRLPGDDVTVVEADRTARLVIEAKLLHLGEPREAVDGEMAYPRAVIEPLKTTKGTDDARGPRQVNIPLKKEGEVTPKEGRGVHLLHPGREPRGGGLQGHSAARGKNALTSRRVVPRSEDTPRRASRAIKILFASQSCYLDSSGGAAVASRAMMEALDRRGFAVEALTGMMLDADRGGRPPCLADRPRHALRDARRRRGHGRRAWPPS